MSEKTKQQEWQEIEAMCRQAEFYIGDIREVLKYKLMEADTPEEREEAYAEAVEAAWRVL